MRVEKKMCGQAPFCSSALISVSGAPASSGRTRSQPAVENAGEEISAPLWVAVALLWTCQPPRPSVRVFADATPGSRHAAPIATSSQNRSIFPSVKTQQLFRRFTERQARTDTRHVKPPTFVKADLLRRELGVALRALEAGQIEAVRGAHPRDRKLDRDDVEDRGDEVAGGGQLLADHSRRRPVGRHRRREPTLS